jgi:hypothetical protein
LVFIAGDDCYLPPERLLFFVTSREFCLLRELSLFTALPALLLLLCSEGRTLFEVLLSEREG